MVFEWGTFSSGWSLGGVLFHLDGLWVRYFFLRVVFGWGASSGWSLGGVLFPSGWSLGGILFLQGGLWVGCFFIRMAFQWDALLLAQS